MVRENIDHIKTDGIEGDDFFDLLGQLAKKDVEDLDSFKQALEELKQSIIKDENIDWTKEEQQKLLQKLTRKNYNKQDYIFELSRELNKELAEKFKFVPQIKEQFNLVINSLILAKSKLMLNPQFKEKFNQDDLDLEKFLPLMQQTTENGVDKQTIGMLNIPISQIDTAKKMYKQTTGKEYKEQVSLLYPGEKCELSINYFLNIESTIQKELFKNQIEEQELYKFSTFAYFIGSKNFEQIYKSISWEQNKFRLSYAEFQNSILKKMGINPSETVLKLDPNNNVYYTDLFGSQNLENDISIVFSFDDSQISKSNLYKTLRTVEIADSIKNMRIGEEKHEVKPTEKPETKEESEKVEEEKTYNIVSFLDTIDKNALNNGNNFEKALEQVHKLIPKNCKVSWTTTELNQLKTKLESSDLNTINDYQSGMLNEIFAKQASKYNFVPGILESNKVNAISNLTKAITKLLGYSKIKSLLEKETDFFNDFMALMIKESKLVSSSVSESSAYGLCQLRNITIKDVNKKLKEYGINNLSLDPKNNDLDNCIAGILYYIHRQNKNNTDLFDTNVDAQDKKKFALINYNLGPTVFRHSYKAIRNELKKDSITFDEYAGYLVEKLGIDPSKKKTIHDDTYNIVYTDWFNGKGEEINAETGNITIDSRSINKSKIYQMIRYAEIISAMQDIPESDITMPEEVETPTKAEEKSKLEKFQQHPVSKYFKLEIGSNGKQYLVHKFEGTNFYRIRLKIKNEGLRNDGISFKDIASIPNADDFDQFNEESGKNMNSLNVGDNLPFYLDKINQFLKEPLDLESEIETAEEDEDKTEIEYQNNNQFIEKLIENGFVKNRKKGIYFTKFLKFFEEGDELIVNKKYAIPNKLKNYEINMYDAETKDTIYSFAFDYVTNDSDIKTILDNLGINETRYIRVGKIQECLMEINADIYTSFDKDFDYYPTENEIIRKPKSNERIKEELKRLLKRSEIRNEVNKKILKDIRVEGREVIEKYPQPPAYFCPKGDCEEIAKQGNIIMDYEDYRKTGLNNAEKEREVNETGLIYEIDPGKTAKREKGVCSKSNPKMNPPSYIILHSTGKGDRSGVYGKNQPKAHFVIGEDGNIYIADPAMKNLKNLEDLLTEDISLNQLNHAGEGKYQLEYGAIWQGDTNISFHSIGIEVVADGGEKKRGKRTAPKERSPKQYEAVNKLILILSKKFNIPKKNIIGHYHVSCGMYGRSPKGDPYNVDWEKLGLPNNDLLIDYDSLLGEINLNIVGIQDNIKGLESNYVWALHADDRFPILKKLDELKTNNPQYYKELKQKYEKYQQQRHKYLIEILKQQNYAYEIKRGDTLAKIKNNFFKNTPFNEYRELLVLKKNSDGTYEEHNRLGSTSIRNSIVLQSGDIVIPRI